MNKKTNNGALPKRRPGRPKGTIKFPEDAAALKRIAGLRLDQPQAPFSKLAQELGLSEEKDIRRLQNKWRKQSDDLLRDERLRRDAFAKLNPLEQMAYGMGWVEKVAQRLVQTAAVFLLDKAANVGAKQAAEEELGIAPSVPLDVDNPAAIARAVRRFEAREHPDLETLIATFPENATLKDLPSSVKFYANALIYYELAEAAKKEEEVGSDDPT